MSLWNATFTDATDWSAVDFLNMFYAATQERLAAADFSYAASGYALTAAGDDVQRGGSGFSTGRIPALQLAVAAALGPFIDPTLAYDGADLAPGGTPDPVFDFASLRTACGFNPDGYRRKRPREVATTASVVDAEGNAAAAGQAAWCAGSLVTYNGAAWVPATGSPDVLDTDAAAPNQCASPGIVQTGDYIGPWLFAEMRDMLNLLVWTTQAAPWSVVGSRGGNALGGDPDWATAKTHAEASYALPAATPFDAGAYTLGTLSPSGTNYDSAMQRGKAAFSAAVPNPYPRAVDWYLRATAVDHWGTATDHVTWDDNGDPVVQDAYSLVNTTAATTAATLAYTFGNLTPPNWCDEPPAGERTVRGYVIRNAFLIARWDVTGGFAYTSST